MACGPVRRAAEGGFSLSEALVAVCLFLVAAAAMLALGLQGLDRAYAVPAQADAQQRARVAIDALVADVKVAGAGFEAGPWAGGLAHYLPALIPRRLGAIAPDLPHVARPDVLTIVSTSDGRRQARLGAPLDAVGILVTEPDPHCSGVPVCGLAVGTTVLVVDAAGRFSLFEMSGVSPLAGLVQPVLVAGGAAFAAGSAVAEVSVRTYYLDAAARELRRYDGRSTDIPVVDDVVGLTFRYFGDAVPPVRPRPPIGIANCLYDDAGAALGGLDVLSGPPEGLVELPLAMFSDGPWCGAGPTAYDVDLLRVRQVQIVLRVQAVPAAVRAAGADFVHSGVSRSAGRTVPDVGLSTTVAPRVLVVRP